MTDGHEELTFPAELDEADLDEIRSIAVEALAEMGKRTVQIDPYVLVTDDGLQFFLTSLVGDCAEAERSQWPSLITHHMRAMTTRSTLEATELSDEEFFALLRARVLPADPLPEFARNHTYAYPLVPDHGEGSPVVALCLDLPDSVLTLTDRHLASRELTAAWAAGLANTLAEPVDTHDQLHVTVDGGGGAHEGAELYAGESFHIASKILDIPALLGAEREAPHGVLFAIPDRNRILLHLVAEAREAAATLNLIAALARDWAASAAGPVSPEVFYWKNGVYQQLTEMNEEGDIAVRVEGRFFDTLNTLSDASGG